MHSFLEVGGSSSGWTSHVSELSPSTFGFPSHDLALTSSGRCRCCPPPASQLEDRISLRLGLGRLSLRSVSVTSPFPSLPYPPSSHCSPLPVPYLSWKKMCQCATKRERERGGGRWEKEKGVDIRKVLLILRAKRKCL